MCVNRHVYVRERHACLCICVSRPMYIYICVCACMHACVSISMRKISIIIIYNLVSTTGTKSALFTCWFKESLVCAWYAIVWHQHWAERRRARRRQAKNKKDRARVPECWHLSHQVQKMIHDRVLTLKLSSLLEIC